jgi:hypothetical protein
MSKSLCVLFAYPSSLFTGIGNAEIGDGELDVMMDESPGSLNFTMFLAMLSSRLQEHRVAIEAAERPLPLSRALEHFSEGTAGTLSVAELEKALRGHLTEAELGSLFQDAPRVGQQAEALLDCRGIVDLLANPL